MKARQVGETVGEWIRRRKKELSHRYMLLFLVGSAALQVAALAFGPLALFGALPAAGVGAWLGQKAEVE